MKFSIPRFYLTPALALIATLGAASAARAGGDESPAEACAAFTQRHYSGSGQTVECEAAYHHYNSSAWKAKSTAATGADTRVRVGSFNLYHMGDSQSAYKNFDLVAQICNQWDVVAGVELMPLPNDEVRINSALDTVIEAVKKDANAAPVRVEVLRANYTKPGYLRLLDALQKLDPNWALIMTPTAMGETVSNRELSGFYYRASKVKPQVIEGCGTLGCRAKYAGAKAAMVSRPPFAAGFKSGKFDAVLLTTHIRFREPSEEVYKQELKELFPDGTHGVTPKDQVARLAEVKLASMLIGKMLKGSAEKDLIFMGDFNLETKKSTMDAWDYVLKAFDGARVYVDTPTSVSDQAGLRSAYDHFILNPSATQECDVAHATSFDFTDKAAFPAAAAYVKGLSKRADEYAAQLKAALTVNHGKVIRRYDDATVAEMVKDYKRRNIESQERNPYQVYRELISDHVPVTMSCETARDDD